MVSSIVAFALIAVSELKPQSLQKLQTEQSYKIVGTFKVVMELRLKFEVIDCMIFNFLFDM